MKVTEAFLDEVKALNIEKKKLDKIIKVIEKQYHSESTENPDELHKGVKIILKIMRISYYKKLKNFSDNFIVEMMDINLDKPNFYEVLDVVNKNYHTENKKIKPR